MFNRGFEKAEHTEAYAKYRPSYPLSLIEKIISYQREKDTGPYSITVDVGCGNGQATKLFASYFDKAFGFDISEEQIKQAKILENGSNMKFSVSPSELLPFDNDSVNLITAATCMHWFNINEFLKECKRILKQNGTLAVFSYKIPQIIYGDKSKILSDRVNNLYLKFRHYFSNVLDIVDSKYEDVIFPLNDIERYNNFSIECNWTLKELLLYIDTWGLIQKHKSLHPNETDFDEFCDEMRKIVSNRNDNVDPNQVKLNVKFDLFLVLCRKI